MQVQIQRGSPLKQSELELPEIPWYNIEGGSMLEWKELWRQIDLGLNPCSITFR